MCDQIIQLKVRDVQLTGGEAYLRPDIFDRVAQLTAGGVRVTAQTGGKNLTPDRVRRYKEAGLRLLGVSVDGLEAEHNLQRGSSDSFRRALEAVRLVSQSGMASSVNTQANTLTLPHLRDIALAVREVGAQAWMVTLTVPAGRATEHPDWVLQPYQVPEVLSALVKIRQEILDNPLPQEKTTPFRILTGTNVGYYSPWDLEFRPPSASWWTGVSWGTSSLFVEADGTCRPSTFLPGEKYVAGNVRDTPIAEMWAQSPALTRMRVRGKEDLWGFCGNCYYGDLCLAGDVLTTEMVMGRTGNNPFCWHRVEEFRRVGRRERLVPSKQGPLTYVLEEEMIPDVITT